MSTTRSSSPTFVEVVVPLALPKTLTYKWFSGEEVRPVVGSRVVVPLGNKKWTGVIWEVHQSAPVGYLAKEVEAVVDDSPILTIGTTRFVHLDGPALHVLFGGNGGGCTPGRHEA